MRLYFWNVPKLSKVGNIKRASNATPRFFRKLCNIGVALAGRVLGAVSQLVKKDEVE